MRPRPLPRSSAPEEEGLPNYLQIDVRRLASWLRAGARWIAACALVGLMLGIAFTLVAKPRYTVTSELLIDPAGLQIVAGDATERNDMRETLLLNADSKLQTMLSRNVLTRVIQKLNLTEDEEFVPRSGLFGYDGSTGSLAIALESLKRRLTARRDERSFVISISVWSQDARKSVQISEVLIDEFKAELAAADEEDAARTANSLVARLTELKQNVNAAEEAVETFRRQNGLRSAQGELSSSRSMVQVDTQLREARERLIAAESRYRQMLSGGTDSAAMQSPTLAALRTQYAAIKQQADEQVLTYGTKHPRYRAAQSRLQSLTKEIANEMSAMTLTARNEYDQAKAVADKLERESTAVSTDVFTDNDAQIRLRELNREASARSAVYEAFLNRARMAAERQQLDMTNLRIISAPLKPVERSWPPSLSQAAVFGLLVGMVLGALGVLGFGIASDINRPYAAPERPASPYGRASRTVTPLGSLLRRGSDGPDYG